MKIDKIPYKEHNLLKAIVETPKGSQHKYDFDPEYKIFKLKRPCHWAIHSPSILVLYLEQKEKTVILWMFL